MACPIWAPLFHVTPPKASPAAEGFPGWQGAQFTTLVLPASRHSRDTASQPVCLSTGCIQPRPLSISLQKLPCLLPCPPEEAQLLHRVWHPDGFYTSEHLPSWLHPLLVLPHPSLLMASLTHHTGMYFSQHGPPDPHILNLAI